MATLHTVNKSPFETNAMLSCLNHCVVGDSVLLIEDGVYGALKGSKAAGMLESLASQLKFYVLGPDAAARGITQGRMLPGVAIVDYPGFVDLVTSHSGTQAWL